MSLLGDPGFELGGFWTVQSTVGGGISTDLPRTGTKSAKIRLVEGLPTSGATEFYSEYVVCTPGEVLDLALYVNDAQVGDSRILLLIEVDRGDGIWFNLDQLDHITTPDGWTLKEYEFQVQATGLVQLRLRNLRAVGALLSGQWFVDDIALDDRPVTMAVKLAERAVDALVIRLQAQLGTELGLIDTDRADGVTMAVPAVANYYKRPKPEIAGATVHVEVFEQQLDFDNPYSDADAQRATWRLPVTVRLTYFNRTQDSADTMLKRMRRYAVGVFNVINKSPTLGNIDAAIQIVAPRSVNPHWESAPDDPERVIKASVTLPLIVHCEETQA